MCGINGILYRGVIRNETLQNELNKMNERIVHRGPDDDGYYLNINEDFSIGMAMRRLSIIDLGLGKQPIYTDDKKIVIVFNGEIYNFKKLREQLEKQNVSFETESDTEVILKLYELYGTSSFAMLDGMFVFSIHDTKLDKLFIVRDFFGEKPLYYTKNELGLIWCSELKSLISILPYKPEISTKGLNLYFQLTYIPAPHTIYKGIEKLLPNTYIEIDCKSFEHIITPIEQNFTKYDISSKAEAIKVNKERVFESVLSRSVSDVPLGTFLSGGVDSSIISLCLAEQSSKKIDTFSIGFKKKSFDETDKSRTVAELIGSNHHEFIIGEKDLTQNIDAILLNFDEPFADSSALASFVVAEKTRDKVKVALTGDGGDEVYGGYNKYYMASLNNKYTSVIPEFLHNTVNRVSQKLLATKDDNRGKRFKARRLMNSIDYEGDFYYGIVSLGYQPNEIHTLLNIDWADDSGFRYYREKIGKNKKSLTDFRNIDLLLSLEGDMLVKVDRTSMLKSLECRAPFLNKGLWNFTSQLPEKYLMYKWDKKHLLKESFKEYFPKGFLDKSKKGFGVPVGDWLRTILKSELENYIEMDFLKAQGIFTAETIRATVNSHISGKEDNTFKVWTFYCFQKWYKYTYKS